MEIFRRFPFRLIIVETDFLVVATKVFGRSIQRSQYATVGTSIPMKILVCHHSDMSLQSNRRHQQEMEIFRSVRLSRFFQWN